MKHKFSILAVTETWLDCDIGDGEVAINNYRLFRRDRPGRAGGGVCIYIHESYKTKELTNISHPSLEMTWVQITLRKRIVSVGCLYRPPNECTKFWSLLDETLEPLQGHDIILMGDLNVNTMDPKDSQLQHLNSINHSHQLHNIIKLPTRITATSSKCIDVILSNNNLFSTGCVEHLPFTDHALIFSASDVDNRPQHQCPQILSRRRWISPVNQVDQLEIALNQTMAQLEASGINEMWDEWKTKFLAALDLVAPVVTTRASTKKRRCPWMTPELLNLIHKQKSAYRKVVKSDRKDADAVQLHRLLRSQSNTLYRRLKNVYFSGQLEGLGSVLGNFGIPLTTSQVDNNNDMSQQSQ